MCECDWSMNVAWIMSWIMECWLPVRQILNAQVLPDEPLCAIPVEVGSGMPYPGQVNAGWRVEIKWGLVQNSKPGPILTAA